MAVPPGPRVIAGSSARAASARSLAHAESHGRNDGSWRNVCAAGPCLRSLPAHALGFVAVLQEPRQLQAAIPRQHDPVLRAEDVASPTRIPLSMTEDRLVQSVDRVDIWIAAEVLGVHEFSDGDSHRPYILASIAANFYTSMNLFEGITFLKEKYRLIFIKIFNMLITHMLSTHFV